MDILISSNLERLLFFASDFNDKLVAELMGKLNTEGSYKVAEDVFAKIEAEFDAGCCDDSHAADTINKLWKDENYLCDTPHRSCRSCIRGLPRTHRRRNADRDRVHRVSVQVLPLRLSRRSAARSRTTTLPSWRCSLSLTGVPAPAPLAALAGKTPRFDRVVDKADILSTVGLLDGSCHGALYACRSAPRRRCSQADGYFRRPVAGAHGKDHQKLACACCAGGHHCFGRGYFVGHQPCGSERRFCADRLAARAKRSF